MQFKHFSSFYVELNEFGFLLVTVASIVEMENKFTVWRKNIQCIKF